ncbi:MAG TPA: hypothetical protein VD884_21305 [Ohtaekwangia sp.]|nr:hypothetical protein [Ohtaekwangia sp.]
MFRIIRIILLSAFFSMNAYSQIDSQVELAFESLNQFINVRDFCISNDTTEVYFTVQSPSQEISHIAYMKKRNGIWDEPQLISFADQYSDLEPFLSPDQMRLCFASNRPRDGSTQPRKDFDIWYVVRKNKNEKWSDPVNMGSPVKFR